MSIEAIAEDGSLRRPRESGETAKCFECGAGMAGKIGRILQPHWAHIGTDTHCRYRSEDSESHWHKAWKYRLAARGWDTEKVRIANGEKHRADSIHPHGTVVELQNKYLDAREIIAREAAYPHMLWLINGVALSQTAEWARYPESEWRGGSLNILQGAARSMHYMRRPVIIDNATHSMFTGDQELGDHEYGIGWAGRVGLFYVGNWSVSQAGGTVDVQCIFRGNGGEPAADALSDWFQYLRWAA